jgi:hypothetical protein
MITSQSIPLDNAITSFPDAPTAYNMQICRRSNFLYYQITKCGCTFIKTLINQIDGRPHDATPEKIKWANDGTLAFVVVRDPIDRFLSLYFDKLLTGPSLMAKDFKRRGLVNSDAATVPQHEKNCLRALGRIKQTVDARILSQMNVHWRPQIYRLHKISKLNVHMLTLDGLTWQMEHLLQNHCSDLAAQVATCGRQNISPKPIAPSLLKTTAIREQISSIYAADEAIYADVNRHWANIKSGLNENGQNIE